MAPVLIILKALGDLDITRRRDLCLPSEWRQHGCPSLPSAVQRAGAGVSRCSFHHAQLLRRDGRTLMLQGTLPSASAADPASCVKPGPLLEKAAARKSGAPDYLPALQLLPAATLEFAYLPENAQGVLMLPLSGDAPGALVLAADRQRGFGEEDISWAREVARKLSEVV